MLHIVNAYTIQKQPIECTIIDDRITFKSQKCEECDVFDAEGAILMPGLVDMHVHFRDPWEDNSLPGENIESGMAAAHNGGVTSCACMPNTIPALDSVERVRYVCERAKKYPGHLYPIAALSIGRKGQKLTPMKELLEAGAVAFSDDGSSLMDDNLMKRALEFSAEEGCAIISHALDETGYDGWTVHEGSAARRFNLKGISSSAESDMVARDIELASQTGGYLHIAHVSTEKSIEYIRRAKDKGVRITCEATPHHLLLSDEDIVTLDVNMRMSPPLRSVRDRDVLREALADGTIDVIASDHAPHSPERKRDFFTAANGITGIETMFSLIITELVVPGIVSFQRALDAMTIAPAHILRIDAGHLAEQGKADCILVDMNAEWICEKSFFSSQSYNTPFIGKQMKSRIIKVCVDGYSTH